jgi:hypothetical protein
MDIWWHTMFYLAFIFYFAGLKLLVKLGSAEAQLDGQTKSGAEMLWSIVTFFILLGVFTLPRFVDGAILMYADSPLAALGLHHFLAFAISGLVATYLVFAKRQFGTIGTAIAVPMTIAVAAFSVQHFWELLTESWKVIDVAPSTIEGVEKIFLVVASVCILIAAWRLKTFPTEKPVA